MRRMKRMMAVLTLAVVASMGAQTAFGGILLSDRNGITVSDRDGITVSDKDNPKAGTEAWDVLVVVVNGLIGITVSDSH